MRVVRTTELVLLGVCLSVFCLKIVCLLSTSPQHSNWLRLGQLGPEEVAVIFTIMFDYGLLCMETLLSHVYKIEGSSFKPSLVPFHMGDRWRAYSLMRLHFHRL